MILLLEKLRQNTVISRLNLALIFVFVITPLRASEVASQPGAQLAAGGRADWQQWDAFITFITKRFGQDLTGNLRDDLIDVFLDSGLMQVNQRVWRGVYDIKGLVGDIEYNGRAGTEILLNYLSRYAIRKGEHKQPGGVSNLARASYAAYNGGPGHLTRYRAAKRNPALKKVDDLFWQKYSAASSGREMDVLQCYD
jgi:hypothetical protein